jgi:hypothetical protein
MVVEWWVQEALVLLQPPEDGDLYLMGDRSDKPQRGKQNPLAKKGRQSYVFQTLPSYPQ